MNLEIRGQLKTLLINSKVVENFLKSQIEMHLVDKSLEDLQYGLGRKIMSDKWNLWSTVLDIDK